MDRSTTTEDPRKPSPVAERVGNAARTGLQKIAKNSNAALMLGYAAASGALENNQDGSCSPLAGTSSLISIDKQSKNQSLGEKSKGGGAEFCRGRRAHSEQRWINEVRP